MSFHVPENQTVCFAVYNQHLDHAGLDTRKHAKRISRAFDYGEPLWMVEYELRMIDDDDRHAAKRFEYPDVNRVCTRRVKIG